MNYMETTAPGGINKTIRELSINLSKRSHEVIVLQSNPLNLPKEELNDGFKIIRVKSRFESNLYGLNPELYLYLKNHLMSMNPDLIHIHGYHRLFCIGVMYTLKKLDLGIPIVFSPHMDVYSSTFAGKYLWNIYDYFGKSIFKDSNYIISPSKFEALHIIDNYSIDKENISIIPHGVNLIDNKEKIIKKNKSCNLIYSGYLIKRKGVSHILDGLNILINELNFRNVKLTIIGEGPEKSNLLKQSKNLKVDDQVIWKSFLSHPEFINEIKNSDIFLLLSNSEAYGITVAEALALGIPCIITKITALNEFINEPGCFGVNYPPDPTEVAKMVLKIYTDDVKVGPFSDKIRTWDKVSKDYENVYLDFLKH